MLDQLWTELGAHPHVGDIRFAPSLLASQAPFSPLPQRSWPLPLPRIRPRQNNQVDIPSRPPPRLAAGRRDLRTRGVGLFWIWEGDGGWGARGSYPPFSTVEHHGGRGEDCGQSDLGGGGGGVREREAEGGGGCPPSACSSASFLQQVVVALACCLLQDVNRALCASG